MSLHEEVNEIIDNDPYHSIGELSDLIINKVLDAAVEAGEKERYGTNKNDHPTDIAHDIGVVDVILAIQRLKEGK